MNKETNTNGAEYEDLVGDDEEVMQATIDNVVMARWRGLDLTNKQEASTSRSIRLQNNVTSRATLDERKKRGNPGQSGFGKVNNSHEIDTSEGSKILAGGKHRSNGYSGASPMHSGRRESSMSNQTDEHLGDPAKWGLIDEGRIGRKDIRYLAGNAIPEIELRRRGRESVRAQAEFRGKLEQSGNTMARVMDKSSISGHRVEKDPRDDSERDQSWRRLNLDRSEEDRLRWRSSQPESEDQRRNKAEQGGTSKTKQIDWGTTAPGDRSMLPRANQIELSQINAINLGRPGQLIKEEERRLRELEQRKALQAQGIVHGQSSVGDAHNSPRESSIKNSNKNSEGNNMRSKGPVKNPEAGGQKQIEGHISGNLEDLVIQGTNPIEKEEKPEETETNQFLSFYYNRNKKQKKKKVMMNVFLCDSVQIAMSMDRDFGLYCKLIPNARLNRQFREQFKIEQESSLYKDQTAEREVKIRAVKKEGGEVPEIQADSDKDMQAMSLKIRSNEIEIKLSDPVEQQNFLTLVKSKNKGIIEEFEHSLKLGQMETNLDDWEFRKAFLYDYSPHRTMSTSNPQKPPGDPKRFDNLESFHREDFPRELMRRFKRLDREKELFSRDHLVFNRLYNESVIQPIVQEEKEAMVRNLENARRVNEMVNDGSVLCISYCNPKTT